MKEEHCVLPGHDKSFTTTNYKVTTTPEKEFKIATGQVECPEEDRKDNMGKTVRIVRKLEELEKHPMAIKAHLVLIEIIALVSCVTSSSAALQHNKGPWRACDPLSVISRSCSIAISAEWRILAPQNHAHSTFAPKAAAVQELRAVWPHLSASS